MSSITSMKELNINLRRVVYDEIEDYAKQSNEKITYFELPDNVSVSLRYDGRTTISFSVSVLLEDVDDTSY